MKVRIARKVWLHAWMRHPITCKAQEWPRGFWRGDGAVGLSIMRLQFMVVYPTR